MRDRLFLGQPDKTCRGHRRAVALPCVVAFLLLRPFFPSSASAAEDPPGFRFPADPEQAILTLDYWGGHGGCGSYREEPDVSAPFPHPYLQVFGDGTVRVRTVVRCRDAELTSHLDHGDLIELLAFVASTRILDGPWRTCAEAATTSPARGPFEVPSSDSGTIALELQLEELELGDDRRSPFTWRATCRDLPGYAEAHPDVPWLSALQAIERRLAALARTVSQGEGEGRP